jgi:hypothetical protein
VEIYKCYPTKSSNLFLNVDKYTSNVAVNGDMEWQPMICRVEKQLYIYGQI